MTLRFFPAAAAIMAMIGSAAMLTPVLAQKAAPQQSNQGLLVVQTPEGGFRMGNPQAPVKLIEYGSLGCPLCARFAAEGGAPLLALVRSGKVSFEFRNYVLSAPDIAAALLSRCGSPDIYFRLNDAFLASQAQWFARIEAAPKARMEALAELPTAQQFAPLAAIAGLDTIATGIGVSLARTKQCLADEAMIDRLVAMRKAAWATYRVSGTPTFIVNGQKAQDVHTWSELAPLLKPAAS
jgi:protein-disulfide isomerase